MNLGRAIRPLNFYSHPPDLSCRISSSLDESGIKKKRQEIFSKQLKDGENKIDYLSVSSNSGLISKRNLYKSISVGSVDYLVTGVHGSCVDLYSPVVFFERVPCFKVNFNNNFVYSPHIPKSL